MDIGHETSSLGIFIIRIHKEFSGFVVERAFWERDDQKASDNTEDVSHRGFRTPVSLKCIDTDSPSRHVNIGMVDLCQEETSWWRSWKVGRNEKFQLEELSFVGSVLRTLDLSLQS